MLSPNYHQSPAASRSRSRCGDVCTVLSEWSSALMTLRDGALERQRCAIPRSRDGQRQFVENPAWLRLHDDGPIRQRHGFMNIVGHHQDSRARLFPKSEEMIVQTCAREGVERRERLVEEQNLGVHRQTPGDGDTLLLSAGEIARPAPGMFRKPDLVEGVSHPRVALRNRNLVQSESDIVGHIQPWQQPRLLKDDADGRMRLADASPSRRMSPWLARSRPAISRATSSCRNRTRRQAPRSRFRAPSG